jgi:hypothetical protein
VVAALLVPYNLVNDPFTVLFSIVNCLMDAELRDTSRSLLKRIVQLRDSL